MALARWMLDPLGGVQLERYRVLVGDHAMHCTRGGSGPALILLHGLLGTASSWEACLPGLTKDSTVYAIDALGIGESDRVPGIDPTLEAQADRVIAFMDESHLAAADFLATSHGGAVALFLATKYPDRVRNLVLHAPANPWSRITDPLIHFYLSGLGGWFAQRVPSLPEPMQVLALGRMYGDRSRLRVAALEKYMASLRIPGTVDYVLSILGKWFTDMAALEKALDGVNGIPMLLIWGDHDRAVAIESAQQLLRRFENAELVELPLTGHVPHEECPDLLARSVNQFLLKSRRPRLIAEQVS